MLLALRRNACLLIRNVKISRKCLFGKAEDKTLYFRGPLHNKSPRKGSALRGAKNDEKASWQSIKPVFIYS